METPLRPIATIGFIGLGVMGEAMCGNLARRAGVPVLGYDLRTEPLDRLAEAGVQPATPQQIAQQCDLVLLSLPDGRAVEMVLAALQPRLVPGQCVADTSTSPVDLTREIGHRLQQGGIGFADAPVARTREAAARGELSIMVGASETVFDHIRPVLETMGTDITHCGPIGCGQVVKILNNMLVFQNVAALAEAIALGRRNGVPPDRLLQTIAKGSGDSFALRSHGLKSMVPEDFPERAFSVRYAMKDLSYALDMAETSGVAVPGARLAMQRLRQAEQAGHGKSTIRPCSRSSIRNSHIRNAPMPALTLDQAQTIVTAALRHARAQKFQPLAVVVLDERGVLKAFAAEDGTSLRREEIARGKAHGALAFGLGSRTLMKRAANNPNFIAAVTHAVGGYLVPVPGGVLIKSNDTIIGAVGISGDNSDNDEACAIAGIEAAGLSADPG